MSAKFDVAPLLPHLEKKLTLLVGQSGMGKSKTVNALVLAYLGQLAARRRDAAAVSKLLDQARPCCANCPTTTPPGSAGSGRC